MKATDLMIGDWVCLVDPDNKNRMNTKVRGVDLCGGGRIVLQWFEPIPLTPEILEKNGFKKFEWYVRCRPNAVTYCIGNGLNLELEEDGFELVDNCSDSSDYGYEANNICEIKYVHELQHALKLCGIEKKIELEHERNIHRHMIARTALDDEDRELSQWYEEQKAAIMREHLERKEEGDADHAQHEAE